ncbi:MAG TPA: hypothetical protein GX391_03100 [Firmicutes bacterium]|jgi:hypothetical protein|nr:hypothetical protein [Bacillota bacterium]HOQ23773.1 hypothetical protein [Bacillota bacterium]HPT66917.1 hypothetical protein [Bacillota bacterium]
METLTVTAEKVPEQIQMVVKWYTQGLLTEEELVQLLKGSVRPPAGSRGGTADSPEILS